MAQISKSNDISVLSLSNRAQNRLRRANIHTVGAMMDYPSCKLIDIPMMGKGTLKEILDCIRKLEEGDYEYIQSDCTDTAHDRDDRTEKRVKLKFQLPEVTDKPINYDQCPSVVEFASGIENKRIREIIQWKIAGESLQKIGNRYGISAERVRQLMRGALERRPYFREDKYGKIYNSYKFTLEEFMLIFNEPKETYYYLEIAFPVREKNKEPLEKILTDETIAPEIREKAKDVIYGPCVVVDGTYVKRNRRELVKYYIQTNCKRKTRFEDFVKNYNLWLFFWGCDSDPELIIKTRSYENILQQCDFALWSRYRSFRYYAFEKYDFEEFRARLNLEQFQDVEFSTLKLFRDHQDLMMQYDIRDEDELHNLLRKIWNSPDVKFKKMPMIEIGSANVSNQLLTLLYQYAPVSGQELGRRYEEKYGVKAGTIKTQHFHELDGYYHNGVYSVDSDT